MPQVIEDQTYLHLLPVGSNFTLGELNFVVITGPFRSHRVHCALNHPGHFLDGLYCLLPGAIVVNFSH